MLNPIIYTVATPKRMSKFFKTTYNTLKKRLMIIFKIKSSKTTELNRKGSESCDLRTSSGLNQNALNSSQITMQCLDRKSSKSSNEQEKYDFTTYPDCNNNSEHLMSINQIKNSVTSLQTTV